MRVRTPILALLLLTSGLTADEKKTEPTTYSSADAKCEIKFADKTKEKTEKDSTQISLEALGGKGTYLLQINKFPSAIAIENEAAVAKIMDSARDALVKSLKGKDPTEKKSVFEKFPARDVELDAAGIGIYRARFILTPTHFYQITTCGPKEFVDGEDAKKFLDSFKIKP